MEAEQGIIQQDIHEIKNSMTSLKVKVELVYNSLVGNELTKDGGLINVIFNIKSDVKILEKKVEEIEKKESQKRLYVKIIWAALAVILTIVIERLMSKM